MGLYATYNSCVGLITYYIHISTLCRQDKDASKMIFEGNTYESFVDKSMFNTSEKRITNINNISVPNMLHNG